MHILELETEFTWNANDTFRERMAMVLLGKNANNIENLVITFGDTLIK
jgi:hypothetical protein